MSSWSAAIDGLIRDSLEAFLAEISSDSWWGRENEAVNRFAMGQLVKRCRPDSVLYDPRQIGIEVAVPQHTGGRAKAQVRKDLVIWPRPGMTCWEDPARRQPTCYPLAILEWKMGPAHSSARDIEWLTGATTHGRELVGYAVALELSDVTAEVHVVRVFRGTAEPKWTVRLPRL
jgi:hypothetical protein